MDNMFRFVVIGDGYWGNKESSPKFLKTLLGHIKQLSPQPDFLIFMGDLVEVGSEIKEELIKWKALVEEFYPITRVYPVIGNHEPDEAAFSSSFPHLPMEQLKGYKNTAYYFDWKDARFIILNSIRCNKKGKYAIDTVQRQWIDRVIQGSDKKYHFVMLHVPAFPTGSHFGESLDGDLEERNAFWHTVDKNNVTAVFAGHEHHYCRRLIDNGYMGGAIQIQKPIYHITSGGGGSALSSRASDKRNILKGPVAVHHFLVIDVHDSDCVLRAYNIGNELFDSCSLDPGKSEPQVDAGPFIFIPSGAEWRFLDNGTDQAEIWTKSDYDDSSWKAGPAELGYGDGGEATKVSYGPDSHRKYITTYFRKKFNVNNPLLYESLTIQIQRDDGAIIYINENEVYRTNMPAGKINYKTLASRALSGIEETAFEKVTVSAGILRAGENIIAVEIHQASASSSDISFNLQLVGNKKVEV